jgi:hypothetical protein
MPATLVPAPEPGPFAPAKAGVPSSECATVPVLQRITPGKSPPCCTAPGTRSAVRLVINNELNKRPLVAAVRGYRMRRRIVDWAEVESLHTRPKWRPGANRQFQISSIH